MRKANPHNLNYNHKFAARSRDWPVLPSSTVIWASASAKLLMRKVSVKPGQQSARESSIRFAVVTEKLMVMPVERLRQVFLSIMRVNVKQQNPRLAEELQESGVRMAWHVLMIRVIPAIPNTGEQIVRGYVLPGRVSDIFLCVF